MLNANAIPAAFEHIATDHKTYETTTTIAYRQDLDALRGIAILAVMIYHLFPDYLPGGFLGVDLFFVISGFLISKIIFTKLDLNTFSFLDFYLRRIKRIFPALTVVMISCLLYGFLVLLPHEYITLGKHIKSATMFMANLTFCKEIGYFDLAAEYKPLLHLWSLAIEEQFYLFWPMILFLTYKIANQYKLGSYKKPIIITMILGVTIISFSRNMYLELIVNHKNKAFYYTSARLWQMSIGAIGAYYSLSLSKNLFLSKISFKLLKLIAIIFIIFSLIFITNDCKYLIYTKFIYSLCVLCLLTLPAESWDAFKLKNLIINRWFIFIGLISYPMYLLHWPLISFIKIINGHQISFAIQSFIVITVLVLAYLIYKYIERPIRQTNNANVVWWLTGGLIIIWLIGSLVYKQKILPLVNHTLPHAIKTINASNDWAFPTANMQELLYQDQIFYKITNPQSNPKEIILFFGDSNCQQYAPRIEKIITSNNSNKTAVFAAFGGLCPLPNVYFEQDQNHKSLNKAAIAYANLPEVKVIVIAAQWIGYLAGGARSYLYLNNGNLGDPACLQQAINDFKILIKKLIANGKQVYIISTMPLGVDYGPEKFLLRNFLGKWKFTPKYIASRRQWEQDNLKPHNFLLDVCKSTGAIYIKPEDFLCDQETCGIYAANGLPRYKDGVHLAASYVKEYITFLDFLLQ